MRVKILSKTSTDNSILDHSLTKELNSLLEKIEMNNCEIMDIKIETNSVSKNNEIVFTKTILIIFKNKIS